MHSSIRRSDRIAAEVILKTFQVITIEFSLYLVYILGLKGFVGEACVLLRLDHAPTYLEKLV